MSNDGCSVMVNREFACIYGLVRTLLSNNDTNTIHLSEISKRVLECIVRYMARSEGDLDSVMILDLMYSYCMI